MEQTSSESAVRTEAMERDPLAFLQEMQNVLRRVRLAGLELFRGDIDSQVEVVRTTDNLMDSALLLSRKGKPLERFHSDISGSQLVCEFVAGDLTKHDGVTRKVPRDSIPNYSSISYKESVIHGLWVEKIVPKEPQMMSSYKLVGSHFNLASPD